MYKVKWKSQSRQEKTQFVTVNLNYYGLAGVYLSLIGSTRMKDGSFSRDGATNIKEAGHKSSFDQIVEDQLQVKAHVFCCDCD